MHDFDYIKAKSIDQASTALLDQKTHSLILAGGTDLVDQMRRGIKTPELIVDIKSIPELQKIDLLNDKVILGGGVPMSHIYRKQDVLAAFPGLETSLKLIGSIQIQNRATIAGNIGNASPSADLVPILVALESIATIATGSTKRDIEIEKLITKPGIIDIEAGELIENIIIPLPKGRSTNSYLRFIPRAEMDIAVVSTAVSIGLELDNTISKCKIALGAVTPKPTRALAAEQYMLGKQLNTQTIKEAAALISKDAAPISDMRASAQYRLDLLPVIGERAIKSCATSLGITV